MRDRNGTFERQRVRLPSEREDERNVERREDREHERLRECVTEGASATSSVVMHVGTSTSSANGSATTSVRERRSASEARRRHHRPDACDAWSDPFRAEWFRVTKAPSERNTRQKQAIRDAFERADRPLSTDEVHEAARAESDGLGLATVYRSIRSLVDDGWLSIVEMPGRSPLYELAGKGHHHHFACERCARVYELEGCASVAAKLPRGFKTTHHELTLYGTCAACAAGRKTGATRRRITSAR